MVPAGLSYTDQHEWLKVDGTTVTVGITDFAQEQLTDIVFVELPDVGRTVAAGDSVAVLESVKSVADVYAPVAGEVIEVNQALEGAPEQVNTAPYEDGWLFKLKVSGPPDLSSLMDAGAYQQFIESQG